ncbi:acyl carrier protein [Gordonia hankookensis]|uniref:Acyl carrier protein n=1 Tax=Gordonia hankookensis TaxID=589403 RepID=A0ABR7WBE8_9ACTN|nr:acyl carrier protein [Gordonia hankookensis]MBD1320137.1 acyl carrier protein [Gordonia hankookensis]
MEAELTTNELVSILVRQAVADVLGVPPTALDATTQLSEYGLDSISSVDLTVQLEEVFDIRIPHRDTRMLATVDGITDYIQRIGF